MRTHTYWIIYDNNIIYEVVAVVAWLFRSLRLDAVVEPITPATSVASVLIFSLGILEVEVSKLLLTLH